MNTGYAEYVGYAFNIILLAGNVGLIASKSTLGPSYLSPPPPPVPPAGLLVTFLFLE